MEARKLAMELRKSNFKFMQDVGNLYFKQKLIISRLTFCFSRKNDIN